MTVFLIIISIIIWLIFGYLSYDLRAKKGYDGGFVLGFLFGIFALIYNAGLPDLILRDKISYIFWQTKDLIKKKFISELKKPCTTEDSTEQPPLKHRTVAECEADMLKGTYWE